MSNNHLIEQIRAYDKNIKEYDAHYVNQDKQVINTLATKNAQEEYLNDEELVNIFKQQVRKIMSAEVKDRERDIRVNI